jgi:hypothetical protein
MYNIKMVAITAIAVCVGSCDTCICSEVVGHFGNMATVLISI